MRRTLTSMLLLVALAVSLMAVVDGVTADDKDKGSPTPTNAPDPKGTDTPELKNTATAVPKETMTPDPKVTETPQGKPTKTKEPKATDTPVPTKQPQPGDTDGDLCPDEDESGADEYAGGRRSHVNPWDYFNPTEDGENRVDDIMAVLDHYHLDEGDPGYAIDYDRTYLGPEKWNLGPPNGETRVDDVLAVLNQYHHDCGKGVPKATATPKP